MDVAVAIDTAAGFAGDTVLGGGVFALLCVVATQLLRRTHDADVVRDRLAEMAMQLAEERERRAYAERDAAITRLEHLRGQYEDLARTVERMTHDEERHEP